VVSHHQRLTIFFLVKKKSRMAAMILLILERKKRTIRQKLSIEKLEFHKHGSSDFYLFFEWRNYNIKQNKSSQ